VSPRLTARIAGALYLVVIATGFFAEFYVRGSMIVSGDAVATAHNILASEPLYRLGFAADLVGDACYIGVTLILYQLLAPVSRSLSLLAAFFSLTGCVVMAANLVNHLAPLLLLSGGPYLSAFTPGQLQALALVALKLHARGYFIAMVFFGLYCGAIGYLMFRSTFFPRLLGLLLMAGGLSDLTNSFALFVAPALQDRLEPYILIPGGVSEIGLCLWLLAIGVDAAKWRAAASERRS
jgi:hypothetical protein